MEDRSGAALTEPPEGVLTGESIPRIDKEEVRRSQVEALKAELKSRGRPYAAMSDAELTEAAEAVYRKITE